MTTKELDIYILEKINSNTNKSSINYLNMGHKKLVCKVDRCVWRSTNGLEKLLVEQSIHQFMITI